MDTATFKGTGMDFVRRQLREKEAEQTLLGALDEDDRNVYANALAVSWIDVHAAARVYEAAAGILYRGSAEPLVDLGRDMAHADLTGIYKVLLRVATIPMVIERTARLWKTYHRKGTPRVKREADAKRADLIVDDYPELPGAIRANVRGYVQGVLDLTGVTNPQVASGGDPSSWRWRITWE